MQFNLNLDPNWISAIANGFTALSVFLAFWQLHLTKKIAQSQFEDTFSKEYRELYNRIPTKAFLGRRLSPNEYAAAFDELFRYIDLSNEQITLRQSERVSKTTWESWSSGIQANLKLPAFERAWEQIHSETESFQELRRAQKEEFQHDPATWKEV
ncbi:MAG: hypothetical protein NTZ64_02550 [Polaromonas sp.]|nr:hypothetical protein [Polaromonas sp.]